MEGRADVSPGIFKKGGLMGREIRIESNKEKKTAIIDSIGARHARIAVNNIAFECELVQRSGSNMVLRVGTRTIMVHEVRRGEYVIGSRVIRVSDRQQDAQNNGSQGKTDKLNAVMPGMVVKILVQEGDEVKHGTPLLVLEAMKMENEVKSPGEGRVKTIRVHTGETVDTGALLVEFE